MHTLPDVTVAGARATLHGTTVLLGTENTRLVVVIL